MDFCIQKRKADLKKSAFSLFVCLAESLLQPDQAVAKGLKQTVLLALANDLVLILALHDLYQDLIGNLVPILGLVAEDLHNENTFLGHISVANGIALTNQGTVLLHQVLALNQGRTVQIQSICAHYHNLLCGLKITLRFSIPHYPPLVKGKAEFSQNKYLDSLGSHTVFVFPHLAKGKKVSVAIAKP